MTQDNATPRPHLPGAVRILSLILYAGFAISVSITAMALFGIVGIALAALFAWQWGRIPALNGTDGLVHPMSDLAPRSPEADAMPAVKSSGNASFDAYRDQLMVRLEKEQDSFETFLTRLRAAKDKAEFDDFLDARARQRPEFADDDNTQAQIPAQDPSLRQQPA